MEEPVEDDGGLAHPAADKELVLLPQGVLRRQHHVSYPVQTKKWPQPYLNLELVPLSGFSYENVLIFLFSVTEVLLQVNPEEKNGGLLVGLGPESEKCPGPITGRDYVERRRLRACAWAGRRDTGRDRWVGTTRVILELASCTFYLPGGANRINAQYLACLL